MEEPLTIEVDDLRSEKIAALLRAHLEFAMQTSPPESVHALDLDGLRGDDITFWSAWRGDRLAGCVALKPLDARTGEIKSMHTAAAERGRGVGAKLLAHLIEQAKARGMDRLFLETGTMDAFAPARHLYRAAGFEPCPPFADYRDDPYSICMTRTI